MAINEHFLEPAIGTPNLDRMRMFYQYADIAWPCEQRLDLVKRILDISFALIGIVLLSPVMILIAIIIKLDSPGPVIFKQKRVGQDRRRHFINNSRSLNRRHSDRKGRIIKIYKFRSMRQESKQYDVSPHDAMDNRITRTGKYLRLTCLDELPQLFNVLKGDLSLVGPRPEMEFIVGKYSPVESLRLTVKPGITGPWQIYGSRDKFIHEDLKYDLDYIRNRSLKMDISILLKTFLFIFKLNNF